MPSPTRRGPVPPAAAILWVAVLLMLAVLPHQVAAAGEGKQTIVNDDTATVWGGCASSGGRPATILSAAQQTALGELMQKAAVTEAMLGGYFPEEQTVGGSWLWMANGWVAVGGIAFYSRYTVKYNYAYPLSGVFSAFGSDANNQYPADDDVEVPSKRYVYASASANTPYEWFNSDTVLPSRVCDYTVFPTDSTGGPESPAEGAKSKKGGFPVWAIAVIVVAGVLIVAAVVVLLYCCCCRRGAQSAETRARREAAKERRAKMAEERRLRPASQRRSSSLRSFSADNYTTGGDGKSSGFDSIGNTETDADDESNTSRGTVRMLRRGSVSIIVPDEESK